MVWNKTSEETITKIMSVMRVDYSLRYGDIAKLHNVSEWLVSELARKHLTPEERTKRYSEINRYAKLKVNPMKGKTRMAHHGSKEYVVVSGYVTEWAPVWWTGLMPKGNRVHTHQRVWCESNGKTEVPKGFDIHHIDEDKFNNDLSNLMCLTRSDHMKLHCASRRLLKRNDYPEME